MAEPAPRKFTYDQYLALERRHDTRLEFLDGVVVAMAGGTPEHALIAGRVVGTLMQGLGRGPCAVATSDLKLHIAAQNRSTYADAAVICGPFERAPHDRNAITNPTVIVEVLSDSTEREDRVEKFDAYATLPSLREYVLVGQHEPRIEILRRNDDGTWMLLRHEAGGHVELTSIGVSFNVEEIFAGVALPPRVRKPRIIEVPDE